MVDPLGLIRMVFLIGELDRCTPEFTLKFLDHTRHYFTIPNIGFVLMLNDHQIYKHIKHVLVHNKLLQLGLNYCTSEKKRVHMM